MKFALLFPGQGSQYIGMCRDLIQQFSVAARVFEEANDRLGYDLKSKILEGRLEELTLSEHAQPAVVTASYALYRVFEQLTEAAPSYAAGHSLGEISALIAAGAISFADGVSFAKFRGALMHRALQDKKGRAGIVVDMEESVLQEIVDSIMPNDYVTITGYNSPKQFIVAGNQTALKDLDKAVDQAGGEFIPFRMMPAKADAPYHSGLMMYLKPEIEEALQKLSFRQPKFPIWSTVTGKQLEPGPSLAHFLSEQLVKPVYWNQALGRLYEAGVKLFIDIGPQQITRNLVKENPKLPECLSFDNDTDRHTIIQKLSKEAVH